jgi:TonB-linked SusC/RagA family outer membrane protein
MQMIRIFCFWAMLCPLISHSQTTESKQVSGTILNKEHTALSGAAVQLIRAKKQTVSNNKGEFSLTNITIPDTLLLTHTGYQTKRIPISVGSNSINIEMEPVISELEEVVVNTGYQSIPKERATGSFVQLDKELITRRVSPNVLDRLDGIASGLIFNRSNVSDELLSIRGRSTLLGSASASPLIVLDNFPYEGDLNNINPEDVLSVTILKDAAAASIWGAKAGNGVIVITTRKGKINQAPKWEFGTGLTTSEKPDLSYNRNYLSSPSFIEIEQTLFSKGFYDANLVNTTSFPAITPAVAILQKKRLGLLSANDADAQLNALKNLDIRTDFNNYIYQPTLNRQATLSLRGGGANLAYSLSLGYDKNKDNLVRNQYERLTLRSENRYTLSRKLEVQTSFQYTRSNKANNNTYQFGSSQTNYTPSLVNALFPYAQLADPSGRSLSVIRDLKTNYLDSVEKLGFLDWRYRPIDEINLADNSTKINDLLMRVGFDYQLSSPLKISVQYQYENQSTVFRNLQVADSYAMRSLINKFSQRNTSTGVFTYAYPNGGFLTQNNAQFSNNYLRAQLLYNRRIRNNHSINFIAGAEIKQNITTSNTYAVYGYNDTYGNGVTNLNFQSSLPANPSGTATLPTISTTMNETTNRFISYYLNGAYTYKDRYTLSMSARKDGANIFGVNTNQQFTPLWSIGSLWKISREKSYPLSWLPILNLRATYGMSGNTLNATALLIARFATSSLTGYPGATISSAPNPDLSWEKVRNFNVGLDFALKGHGFSGTIEYYRKNGIDLIEAAPLAPSTGFTSFNGNAASTRTSGFDIVLHNTNLKGSFGWQTDFLLSSLHDEVTHFDTKYAANSLVNNYGSLIAVEGKPLFGIFSYRWAGLDPSTGDPMGYLNKQISKDYTNIINTAKADSLVFNGSARPTFFGSLRNTFNYKNLSLSFNVMYKLGYYFRRTSTSLDYANAITNPGLNIDYDSRWQKPGDEAKTNTPSLVYPSNTNRSNFYKFSEILVEKADNIRLQDIQLSYQLPDNKKVRPIFSHVQVYIYATNLGLIWRANHLGIDPDFNGNSPSVSYTNPKTISLGIRCGF